jgi:hypothetical protein
MLAQFGGLEVRIAPHLFRDRSASVEASICRLNLISRNCFQLSMTFVGASPQAERAPP